MGKRMTWLRRIQHASRRGFFTSKDLNLAENWATCMISERPRTRHWENEPTNEPVSKRLHDLGMEFYYAVLKNTPAEALELRKKILSK